MSNAWTEPLDDPKILEDAKAALAEYVEVDNELHADFFVQYLDDFWKANPGFATAEPRLNGEYENLYWQMKWIALPFRTARELPELFEKRITVPWQMPEYDFWEKLRGKLLKMDYEERDPLKKQILQALERSSTVIAGKPLGTWVKNYLLAVGPPPSDSLKQSQYFSTNKDFVSLPTPERDKLQKLLELVDHARVSTFSPEGFEEGMLFVTMGGRIGLLRGRTFDAVDESTLARYQAWLKPKSPEAARKEMMTVFAGDPATQKQIDAGSTEVALRVGADRAKVAEELRKLLRPAAAQKTDSIKIAALVFHIIKAKLLIDILRREAWIIELIREKIGTKHPEAVDSFKLTPDAPASLSAFLQIALRDVGGFSDAESARLGMHIANALRVMGDEKYLSIVHYNPESKRFEWADRL